MPRDDKGFSLIELLITISLLVVVIIALFMLYDSGRKTFQSETNEIVTGTELRNATDRLLSECRKAKAYDIDDDKLIFTDHTSQVTLSNGELKLVETSLVNGKITEIFLAGDIGSFVFDVGTEEVKIGIYSRIKDANDSYIYLESDYYIRKDHE